MFNSKTMPARAEAFKTEEEALLEADVEDKKTKHRKIGLHLNYDEDSSDDANSDDNQGAESKLESKTGTTSRDDENDDMFASEDDENTAVKDNRVKATNSSNYLEQFEQEMQEHAMEGTEALDDEEEEEAQEVDLKYYNEPEMFEEGRIKPAVEPKIEAFNLKDETMEGTFDEDGNFVRSENAAETEKEEEQKDAWYSEHSKKSEIEKTRKAKEERERKLRTTLRQEHSRAIDELLALMISHLEPAETPMEKLASLNKKKAKNKKKQQSEDPQQEMARRQEIEEITSAANSLISKGRTNVYEETREELMRYYKEETGQDFVTNRGSKRKHEDEEFEFVYIGDDMVHGPYSKEEILDWKESYFEGNVLVRVVGDEEFVEIDKFDFE